MSWRNRSGVMEKSSIFEREIVYLITCFLCCHWEIVLFSLRNLAIFEIFMVMEKSSIFDWEINMHWISWCDSCDHRFQLRLRKTH